MAETQTISKGDVATVAAVIGEKPKTKRTRKPIEIPDPSKFEGPGKAQIVAVLESSKAFVDTVKAANAVQQKTLISVQRGVNQAIIQYFGSLRKDPKEAKRAKLEAQIAKATAALQELMSAS